MAKLTRKQSKYFNDILRRLKMAEDYLKDETRCGGTYHLPDSRLPDGLGNSYTINNKLFLEHADVPAVIDISSIRGNPPIQQLFNAVRLLEDFLKDEINTDKENK